MSGASATLYGVNDANQNKHMSQSGPHPSSSSSGGLGRRAYNPTCTTRAGVLLPPSPAVRLVPGKWKPVKRTWEVDIPEKGYWRVIGSAGTGVSSFCVDVVMSRLENGADPAGVLVIAASKESGSLLRRELSVRLDDYASSSTMVRSVHSLAFALLRSAEQKNRQTLNAASAQQLRLITGAEQDVVIRELLCGHVQDGGSNWPEFIHPALSMVGFARQLRDFMLRASERGLGPGELEDLGWKHNRPMWVSAGRFMREYEQVSALSGTRNLSAAELVATVALHPELTAKHQWHTIVVDDAQLLDPNAGALIRALAQDAQLVVVGGDPDQAVFAFRGANEEFLENLPQQLPGTQTIELTRCWRLPEPACLDIVSSQAQRRDAVADLVRRRHLEDGVPWSDIAVVVRGGGEIGQVRRTLLAAGVPVHINPTDVVLSQQRLVAAILQALHIASTTARNQEAEFPLNEKELEEFLTGPVGGADPVTLRRLIRGLRRFDPSRRGVQTLRELMVGPLPDFGLVLTERELAILERVRSIIGAGREAVLAGGSIEECLWAVWNATELSERLRAAALRGGVTGSQADRDLDAMMALFDVAGDYCERYPDAHLDSFLLHIQEQELPTGVRDRRSAVPEAVEIISAHGAVGREWDTVVVVGAQEGTWPSLGETGSLFGQEDLIDLIDEGIKPGSHVSHLVDRLGEERRLFHVATTRHRRRLSIVAIDQPEGDEVLEPSRFLSEFVGSGLNVAYARARREAEESARRTALARAMGLRSPHSDDAAVGAATARVMVGAESPVLKPFAMTKASGGLGETGEIDPLRVPVLSAPAFVAHLRRVLKDPNSTLVTRSQAARQLARLAQAGVSGADPDQWWSVREAVSHNPQSGGVNTDDAAIISPSQVEALMGCPLRAVLGNFDSEDSDPLALVRGSMAHAFLEALGRGMDEEQAAELTRAAYAQILDVPAWKRDYELQEFDRTLQRTAQWVRDSRGALELVGVEVPVHVTVAEGVRIHGYIDRLERGGDDLYVVDLKTGKTAANVADIQDHPQLTAYQLALSRGRLLDDPVRIVDGEGVNRGGGMLVYPAKDSVSITVRQQAAVPAEELMSFADLLPELLEKLEGNELTALPNKRCDSCPVRTLCPVRPEGRMTTDVA